LYWLEILILINDLNLGDDSIKTNIIIEFTTCIFVTSSALYAKPKKKDPLACASDVFLASSYIAGKSQVYARVLNLLV